VLLDGCWRQLQRPLAGSVGAWPLVYVFYRTNLGGTARAVDAAMVDSAYGGPPLGVLRVALPPLWRSLRRRVPWGTERGKADMPSGVPTAWPRTLPLGAPMWLSYGLACRFRCPPVTKFLRRRLARCRWPTPAHDSYLVDSASSHMLVSKIKPCMSKYKQLYSETANGSLYKLSFI
jgi:hypothetical protein